MNKPEILRWGITFLQGNPLLYELGQETRDYLMGQATEMYLEGKSGRRLQNDEIEGTLITEGEYAVLGIFSGQEFKAHIDSDYGDFDISFIVDERTNKGSFVFERTPNLN